MHRHYTASEAQSIKILRIKISNNVYTFQCQYKISVNIHRVEHNQPQYILYREKRYGSHLIYKMFSSFDFCISVDE